jgi:MFS family permease
MPSALQYNVGLSHNMSLLLAGAINCMFCVGAAIPTFLLDRMGRRGPMMYGAAGLALCMLLVAVLLSFQRNAESNPDLAKATASASVTFFFTYMIIFAATIAVVPWAYVPEILPLHARAKGTSIGISSNWLWNFVVVMITPTIISRLQWQAYLIFMCTNLSFVPLVYFFYPETTNLTLEEVDYLFVAGGASESIFRVSKKIAKPPGDRIPLQHEAEKNMTTVSVEQVERSSNEGAKVEAL